MKKNNFIVYGDIHYGEYAFSGIDEDTGFNRRLLEIAEVDDQITDYAIEHKAWVLFVGDRFKLRNPQGYVRDLADQKMKERAAQGVFAMYLVGNHDMYEKSLLKGSSYGVAKIFGEELSNVIIMDEPRTYEAIDGTLVHALPSGFSMRDADFSIDESRTNVLVFHALLNKSIVDESSGITINSEISQNDMDKPEFDFVLGGDVHVPQKFNCKHTTMGYVGSALQIDRGDIGVRGWWYVTTSEGGADIIIQIESCVPQLVTARGSVEELEKIECFASDYKKFTVIGNFTNKEVTSIRKKLKNKWENPDRIMIIFEPIVERVETGIELSGGRSPIDNWKSMVENSAIGKFEKDELVSMGEKILLEVVV